MVLTLTISAHISAYKQLIWSTGDLFSRCNLEYLESLCSPISSICDLIFNWSLLEFYYNAINSQSFLKPKFRNCTYRLYEGQVSAVFNYLLSMFNSVNFILNCSQFPWDKNFEWTSIRKIISYVCKMLSTTAERCFRLYDLCYFQLGYPCWLSLISLRDRLYASLLMKYFVRLYDTWHLTSSK